MLAIFKELGVAKRLSSIVEGESLFNDGTSIVLFRILMLIALTGQFSLVGSIQQFVQVAFGGALLGLLIGYFFSHLIRPIDDANWASISGSRLFTSSGPIPIRPSMVSDNAGSAAGPPPSGAKLGAMIFAA